MSLDEHINEALGRKAEAKLAEERLRHARAEAEERAAAEAKARGAREQARRANSLGPKEHLVYVGRGMGDGRRTYPTRVDEWRYRPRYSYCSGGWLRGDIEVSEGISYTRRATFHLERLTTVDVTEALSGLLLCLVSKKERERVVGYYLPEWDVSITTALLEDVRAYQEARGLMGFSVLGDE